MSQGGYNLDAISSSSLACTRVLLGEAPGTISKTGPDPICVDTVNGVILAHKPFWACFRKLSGPVGSTTNMDVDAKGEVLKIPPSVSVDSKYFCGRDGLSLKRYHDILIEILI